MTAPANTSLTLVICVLLDVQPSAVPLLGGVAVFLLITYRAYSSLRQRYESLSLLYDFTHLVSGVREPDAVLDAMLTQAKDLLRAERAEFWMLTGPDRAGGTWSTTAVIRRASSAPASDLRAPDRRVRADREARLSPRRRVADGTRAILDELDARRADRPDRRGDDTASGSW